MRRWAAIGFAAALLVAGCGQSQAPAKPKPVAKSVALPTSGWNGSGPAQTAGFVGVLEGSASSECVWLSSPPLRRRASRKLGNQSGRGAVLWPKGYRARFHPVEVLNASGKVVAHGGDIIQFGGGIGSVSPTRRCMFGQRNASVVQSPISVTGRTPSQD